ncbi:MAG: argininosuccinate lyase [Phycisphaerales bacterium]|nr:argininosuccinate lyase [Planctomycetota bacterium]MCH8507833.1 argininosuccinate lyase [Phycisphaerales bacterium]
MSTLLWQKQGVRTDAAVMRFLAGDDVLLDRELFPFDLRATAAHAEGLALRSLLPTKDADAIVAALHDLSDLWSKGDFVLDDRYEDGHSAIEAYLTERLGETGGRVHLGRSRNDQVLVATRLYMLDALDRLKAGLVESARAALDRARADAMSPMPGYTHLQRAVPSSVGLWMGSFAESFAETAELVGMTRAWINASPLGTAAGYGVNLPLAREEVAAKLGFARVVINPMAAQASRGKHEHQVLSAMWQAMQDIRRLAWDLSLFSTAEFDFVRMPPETVTGSSIMPNKKNPDLAELLRASCAVVAGAMAELQQVLSLPSGYHRDLQLTKPALIRATRITLDAVALIPDVLRRTEFKLDRMRAANDGAMMATDKAVELAAGGMSFRDAYRQVGESLDELRQADPEASLAARVSLGGCANLGLDAIAARIDALG